MSDLAVTQAFYSRWARLYDVLATAPGVRSWRAAVADALGLARGDTVVEMGCGTGANLPHLRARVGSAGRVVGIDLTAGMLDRARARVEKRGWENVHLVRGDARRPPIEGPVNAVLATFVVGMFHDPGSVVTDWLGLLGDDGRIALLNATRSPHGMAAPLNLAFRVFVRLSTPGGAKPGSSPDAPSPTAVLEERIADAGAAVDAGTATSTSTSRLLAGGFVRLHSGEV